MKVAAFKKEIYIYAHNTPMWVMYFSAIIASLHDTQENAFSCLNVSKNRQVCYKNIVRRVYM